MLQAIKADYFAVFTNDPAARTRLEVILCYPGFHALVIYRLSHALWRLPHGQLVARLLSHMGRFFTGVEIHPAANIGHSVFIDHGMGVVIGETAEVGDDTVLFHGVTLGGTGKQKGKRHPTIGSGVVLGAHSIVLGPVTVGANSRIGAGAVVLSDVPPNATIVGVPSAQRVIFHTAPS
jgi:serine O-acetyltransferase